MGLFDLREVSVDGTHRLSAQRVWELSGLRVGSNLLRLPLSAAQRRLRALPWIADARLSRQLPHTLRIEVIERIPIAAIPLSTGAGWAVIAEGGVVVERRDDAPEGALLRLRVPTETGHEPEAGDRVAPEIAALLEALHSVGLVPPAFTELDLQDPDQVRLYGAGSTTVHLGSLADAPCNARQLSVLLDQIIAGDYRSIDLTYDDEAILVPR